MRAAPARRTTCSSIKYVKIVKCNSPRPVTRRWGMSFQIVDLDHYGNTHLVCNISQRGQGNVTRDVGVSEFPPVSDSLRSRLNGASGRSKMANRTRTLTHTQLTSLRESITRKPPYISGTLQLPSSNFSLFYKVTKDGDAARFGYFGPLLQRRRIC